MKKVYKFSSLPVASYTFPNEISDVSCDQSTKSDNVECDKKLDTIENSQLNIPQYKVITVPVHKIKILNVKKTTSLQYQSVKMPLLSSSSCTNLMHKLHSNSNSSLVVGKEVTKISKPISAEKIVKPFNKKEGCNQLEDDSDTQLVSPSSRWLSQPRSYRGAKKDYSQRKIVRKISVSSFVDTTDGETSGMGSSVDEPVESSTESASEAPSSFLQPRLSSRPMLTSPSAIKKRRGGWPKGRKRKPEPTGTKTPKAPQTAYVLFLNERRKFYKDTHPNLPSVEVTKLLGAEWSSMTQAQKSVYITRSEQDKKRYRHELQTFRQSPDYQILLRKKRIKNAINRGQTTEESSDFTDEVDEDDSEELHCRTCDQWFSSIHNKREHLYGKPHLQEWRTSQARKIKAITGEYQREREAEMRRRMASPTFENVQSLKLEDQETLPDIDIKIEDEEMEEKPLFLDGGSSRRDSLGLTSTTEDDHDYDDDDDEDGDDDEEGEDSEYDDEGEVTEEEMSTKVSKEACGSCNFFNERVTDAAEGVINKVLNREMEIRFLRNRYEKSRRNQRKIYATLTTLQNKQKLLQEKQQRLMEEEKNLMEKAASLAKISELCKNRIQLRNSEREFDVLESFQLGSSSNIDPLPYRKLSKICWNSSNHSSLDSNSSSASQEISNSSLFLGSNKNDKVIVLSNEEINNPVDYAQFSFDLTPGEELNRVDVICKDISVAEANVDGIENKSVNELQEYQDAFSPQTVNEDLITSKVKVDVSEPVLDELETHSNHLQSVSAKFETDHSYCKLSYTCTSLSKKKTGKCKNTWNSAIVNGNLHPDTFGGTKFKRSVNELLNNFNNCRENIEFTEPPSIHSQCHLRSICKQNDSADHTKLNTSQSHFSQNVMPTFTKLCVKEKRATKIVDSFHSIKDKPPNRASKSSDNTNNIFNALHTNSNDINTNDKFYFSNEIIPLEESSDADYYINNFIQEEIGYRNSASKLLTISEVDLLWEDVSKSQKFRYNLNTLPSLDNIFEDDDAVGNVLSDTS